MKNNLYPCLWFKENAAEAAAFYVNVFKNENTHILSENPIVSVLHIFGQQFMCLNDNRDHPINPSISFFITSESKDELAHYWNLLSTDGKVMMPMNKYPWSEQYGWCADRFGVNWQLMLGEVTIQKITPNFMFTQAVNGKAEEALNFYISLFPHSSILELNRYVKGEPDTEGNIKHGRFKLNNQLFAAMDSSAPHSFSFNEGISIVVPCDSQEEIDFYWDAITREGKENRCGWCKDKYGISWQIVPSILGSLMNDPSRSQRVIQAFMKMKKFDIEVLKTA